MGELAWMRARETDGSEETDQMTTEELRIAILDTLRKSGPCRSTTLAKSLPSKPSNRRVQQELWELNSRGHVVITPDSRWKLVTAGGH